MFYGIHASGDVKLSGISRELTGRMGCTPKKREERLSRHLLAEDMTGKINAVILKDARPSSSRRCISAA